MWFPRFINTIKAKIGFLKQANELWILCWIISSAWLPEQFRKHPPQCESFIPHLSVKIALFSLGRGRFLFICHIILPIKLFWLQDDKENFLPLKTVLCDGSFEGRAIPWKILSFKNEFQRLLTHQYEIISHKLWTASAFELIVIQLILGINRGSHKGQPPHKGHNQYELPGQTGHWQSNHQKEDQSSGRHHSTINTRQQQSPILRKRLNVPHYIRFTGHCFYRERWPAAKFIVDEEERKKKHYSKNHKHVHEREAKKGSRKTKICIGFERGAYVHVFVCVCYSRISPQGTQRHRSQTSRHVFKHIFVYMYLIQQESSPSSQCTWFPCSTNEGEYFTPIKAFERRKRKIRSGGCTESNMVYKKSLANIPTLSFSRSHTKAFCCTSSQLLFTRFFVFSPASTTVTAHYICGVHAPLIQDCCQSFPASMTTWMQNSYRIANTVRRHAPIHPQHSLFFFSLLFF